MALFKKFIIVFGIVFTLLLYISSNPALASRQLYQLSEEENGCNTASQTEIEGCSESSQSTVETTEGLKDPPSEATPCKGGC
ncbi:unnamed protein product [Trifolium pratense]|uniref:Uncharacterized protein n=1 Tax=Trifolium pratense TaxID=57577 RepID=A0ACB0IYU5_TRIPR|nr:unnamed protein product [Trifolium pratense]